ncbi:DUF3945 domain-containing protein [Dysgonomonas sp. UBA7698]|uniref:DUF3945 domain-containing protein n=1 Tax=Dysgonomonas sp. UBA7698 TaxID=1946427 RepID=UPI0025BCA07F|nr:DUF3945 domain-containing protein [Dysgonomonas sp. UBA7698]
MAKQTKPGENTQEKGVETPEKSHLVITDSDKKTVNAVSGVDKDGNLKTVPATQKNQKNFMDVGSNSDVMDLVQTAWRNFLRQAKDPNQLKLFQLPEKLFNEMGKNVKDLFNGLTSKLGDKFLINQGSTKKDQTQEPVGTSDTSKKYRIMPGMVDWQGLKEAGISKELLEKKGFLEPLLQGRKSPDTMHLNINVGSMSFQGEAKISLRQQDDTTYGLRLHPVKLEPEFGTPYRGHVFTDEDKKNLLSTGNMGRVVDLIDNDFQMTPSVISLDRKTNEIHSYSAEHIYIHPEIAGVKLQQHEIDSLKAGEAIKVEGFMSKAQKPFDAVIQYDAVDRRVAFQFNNEPGMYNRLGGVELSEQQKTDLQAGKVILMEDMKRKGSGELYDAYVKLDPVSGRPSFNSFNPESPEGAREIIIPKYVGGVKLEAEDRKDLAQGSVVFLKDLNIGNATVDKFLKMHPESGRVMMSNFPDGFDENQRPKLDIPEKMFGVKITASMRGKIQSGEAVEIKGAIGTDMQPMPLWVKANRTNTAMITYHTNPDEKKSQTQTAVIPRTQDQSESQKKTSGHKM